MNEAKSRSETLATATQRLQTSSPSAQIDAQSLLCHVLNCNSAHLAAWPEKPLTPEQAQHYNELITQREAGTPVAYLTGQREFWSLEFAVSTATLIPRPETETLVEFVLEKFVDRKHMALADLGTGCGAIAIALASERPDWRLTATDISEHSLELARANAEKYQLSNIEFIRSNWFEQLQDKRFDVVISNPPYVADNDPHLLSGDVAHEPVTALASGRSGLDDIESISRQAHRYLRKHGWLVLEHGYDQKQAVRACLKNNEFDQIMQINDLSGQPRMTAGRITTY